jgi:hypothetical protein
MDACTVHRGDCRRPNAVISRDGGDDSKASERFEFRALESWQLRGHYGSIDGHQWDRSTRRIPMYLLRSLAAEVGGAEVKLNI